MSAIRHKGMAGLKFGRLTVIAWKGTDKFRQAVWTCLCDCGASVDVIGSNLRKGATKSCGCLFRELNEGITIGVDNARIHRIWTGMIQRCTNPRRQKYSRYGGRGIAVCIEWRKFDNFRTWALNHGYAPTLTIEREDNDGNYEPSNCIWATLQDQAINRPKRTSGVSWHSGVGKWYARVQHRNRVVLRKLFDDYDEACKAVAMIRGGLI